MMQINEEKWEQIKYIFNYLIPDDKYRICPNCGMPYVSGHYCISCGYNPENDEDNEVFTIN